MNQAVHDIRTTPRRSHPRTGEARTEPRARKARNPCFTLAPVDYGETPAGTPKASETGLDPLAIEPDGSSLPAGGTGPPGRRNAFFRLPAVPFRRNDKEEIVSLPFENRQHIDRVEFRTGREIRVVALLL